MSTVFAKIPECLIKPSNRVLNQITSDEKTTKIKMAMYICDGSRQTELVVLELADDSVFIPAIFKPDEIRKKFGLSDLSLSIEALEERIVKIKEFAVSAYSSNGSIYPYLIVTDFEYIKGRSRINDGLQHVYTVKQVQNWLDRQQQCLPNLHDPVSRLLPSKALLNHYRDLAALERRIQALFTIMYEFEPRVPANTTRPIAQPSSIRNRNERGNKPSGAMHGQANRKQPAAIEWHRDEVHRPQPRADTRSRAPPANHATLQDYLLSTFDAIEEIPDDLCIDSESELKEETRASTPSPSPFANTSHFAAASPSVNTSPAPFVAASFSPEPAMSSYPSYSPGPSDDNYNRQVNLYDPRVRQQSTQRSRPHEFGRRPGDANSMKRRRWYSDFRQTFVENP